MSPGLSRLRVRIFSESGGSDYLDAHFSETFRIGRDPACGVRVTSALVSRIHAEIWPGSWSWWVRDLGSTNGLILNGVKVDRAELHDGDTLQLGKGAPILSLSLEATEDPARSAPRTPPGPANADPLPGARPPVQAHSPVGGPPVRPPPPGPEEQPETDLAYSLEEVREKYLNPDSDRPAGQRTQFIRMAFAQVQKKERRKARLVLASVGLLLVISASYGIYQRQRVRAIERQASEFFQLMKSYEVQLVALRQQLEESGSPALAQQLTALDSARRNAMESYEAFVRERGLYRRLRTQEERLIYETARVFGESEFEISNSFIQAVLAEIRDYWLSGGGRARLLGAIRRAEENGYTDGIIESLTSRGVPPEFFYLALQESEFNARAVGPETRWGRAKGMWQFIPATAERYGLSVGSRTNTAEADPNDERLDFALATDAAARYLRDLHGILTQASGLLVMAAYNWGEHRVLPRLEDLPEPQEVFREEFAGVPTNPAARNYWTFLTEYGDRMPEETKQYVIRIFAAAVIGRDPGYFGLNVENPLGRYVN